MTYAHQLQHEWTAEITVASTGDKAEFVCPSFPIKVKRIGLLLSAAPGDAGVVKFDKRPTYESDTGRGDGDVGTLNLATTHAAGAMVYKDVDVALSPGDEVVVEVTDASANPTACRAFMMWEPDWDTPANCADMVAST